MARAEAKRDLRKRMRALRGSIAPAEREAMSRAACERLGGVDAAAGAGTVAVYAAHRGEVDPAAFARARREAGTRVCYPRIAPGGMLNFHVADEGDLRPGAMGIREPPEEAP